jgi:hypothetical protein
VESDKPQLAVGEGEWIIDLELDMADNEHLDFESEIEVMRWHDGKRYFSKVHKFSG